MKFDNKTKSLVRTVSIILIVTVCMSALAGCTSKKTFAGNWLGEWEYKENQMKRALVIKDNGSYASTSYMNGERYKVETGNWDIEDGKLVLTPTDSDGVADTDNATIYEYVDKQLVDGNAVLSKQ